MTTILNLIESSKLIELIPQGLYIDSKEEAKVSFFASPIAVTQETPNTFYPDTINTLKKIETRPKPVLESDQYLYAKDLFLSLLEKETKCFSKFSSRDDECKNCMISDTCSETKNILAGKRNVKRTKKSNLEDKAQKLGFTFKGLRTPKKANFKDFETYICQHPISCVVTNKNIQVGENMCHVKYFGIVHPSIIDLLIEWKKL